MSTNNGDSLSVSFLSTFGNVLMHHAAHNWTSELEDDVVLIARVRAGTRITDMRMLFEAFGAARTIDVGYKAVRVASAITADPDYFTAGVANTAAEDVENAGSVVYQFAPYVCTEDMYITATIAGAAGADADTNFLIGSIFGSRGAGSRM